MRVSGARWIEAPAYTAVSYTHLDVYKRHVDKESLERAMDYDLDFVIAQGTTTDAGPYYLGAAKPVMAEEALRRDLELIITIAKANGCLLYTSWCHRGLHCRSLAGRSGPSPEVDRPFEQSNPHEPAGL